MMLILEVLGAILLLLIIGGVMFYFYLRYKFGKWMNVDPEMNWTPLRIHLNEDLSPSWLKDKKSRSVIESIEALGFRQGDPYIIPEMNNFQLLSFFNPPYSAVLYYHELTGLWIDFVAESEKGAEFTVTSAPTGAELSTRPEMTKVAMQETNAPKMFEQIKEISAGRALKKIRQSQFRSLFESSFEKDILWKNRKGGISYEEFLAIERETDWKNSKKNITEAFIATKVNELNQWHQAVLEQHQESAGLSEDAFDEMEWRFSIVPNKTDTVSFIHYLEENGFLDEDDEIDQVAERFRDETDIEALFDRLNGRLSPDLRAVQVGSYDYPLPIKLYLRPE